MMRGASRAAWSALRPIQDPILRRTVRSLSLLNTSEKSIEALSVPELTTELTSRNVCFDDCFEKDALRERLISSLLSETQTDAQNRRTSSNFAATHEIDAEMNEGLMNYLPFYLMTVSSTLTGYEKDVLCCINAWDLEDEHTHYLCVTEPERWSHIEDSIKTFFARERAGGAGFTPEEVAGMCQDVCIAFFLQIEGVRLLRGQEHADAMGIMHGQWVHHDLEEGHGTDQNYNRARERFAAMYRYDSPIPPGWRPNPANFHPDSSEKFRAKCEEALEKKRQRDRDPGWRKRWE